MAAERPATLPAGTRVAVLTVSDGVSAGVREDRSGAALAARIDEIGGSVTRGLVPDDIPAIAAAISAASATHALVLTTGGTGLTPRDVTPQATRSIVTYEIPGIAEAMRAAGRRVTPLADLSRAIAGVVGRSLVINVPGSPGAALESLAAVEPLLAHALETLAGPHDHDHARRAAAAGARDEAKENAG
ncbi:MAG: MogA/MoaB family molybdenum cofactor biosynthesis protein [Chloroflexi bacterium]|nr:MogA/MoaB family molybdenum cofactor biosynthesis protein [Chloroflexota bacterium]